MHAYTCTLSLAWTYVWRNPSLARELALEAHSAAIEIKRPDLAYKANDLLAALS